MIIDEMSIDPRRILQATIGSVDIGWRIDEKAYRGALADAIASDRLIDDDADNEDDEECRIGFKVKE